MARPRATTEQRDEQRRHIRRAASDLYREKGPGGVTVRAVAVRAGVSTGALYSYFANLEELMQSLWLEPVAAVGEKLEAMVSTIADPIERVRALLEAYAQFADDEPEVFRGAILFVRPASSPSPPVEPPESLPFYRLLLEAVTDGQGSGTIRPGDAGEITQVLWAGIHGAVSLPIHLDRFDVEADGVVVSAMVDALLRSVCVEQD